MPHQQWKRLSPVAPPSESPLRKDFHLATFNVRGLSAKYKQTALVRDLKAHSIDLCCLQETKMVHVIDTFVQNFRIITFDTDERARGLGFAVGPRLEPYLRRVWRESLPQANRSLTRSTSFSFLSVWKGLSAKHELFRGQKHRAITGF